MISIVYGTNVWKAVSVFLPNCIWMQQEIVPLLSVKCQGRVTSPGKLAIQDLTSTTHCGCWHSTKKPVTTMLTYPWKCTVLHCNHLGNTWKPLVLMTRHFDYCPSASEGDNQSVLGHQHQGFPGVSQVVTIEYISRSRLAWWLLAFWHSVRHSNRVSFYLFNIADWYNVTQLSLGGFKAILRYSWYWVWRIWFQMLY